MTTAPNLRARQRRESTGARCSTSAAAVLASTALAGIARPAVAQRGPVRTLIKGGVVLSYDPAVGDFERADVLIEDRRIAAVAPGHQRRRGP